MTMRTYFENTSGTGVLSTVSAEGIVNSAIYARPHVLEDGQVAFIMADRLSRKNLQDNPSAAYLFIEDGDEYRGTRLQLTRVAETQDPERIRRLRRRTYAPADEARIGALFLVHFRVEAQRPLVGAGPQS